MSRLNAAFPRALDDNGDAVSGAKLYVYTNRTTTPVTTYSDAALTTAQAHPVISDASGEFASVYVGAGAYTIKITDADDVTLYEADDFISLFTDPADTLNSILNRNHAIQVACSDQDTDLTTGTAKVTFRAPQNGTIQAVRASVNTAPTGSGITVDINQNGSSILSTKITIDVGEKTSTAAATAPVISNTDLVGDAEITVDIDQVGSTVAGTGLVVTILYLPD